MGQGMVNQLAIEKWGGLLLILDARYDDKTHFRNRSAQ